MPSVLDLRKCINGKLPDNKKTSCEKIVVHNIVGEARSMHSLSKFQGGVVQAASQFNFLEFGSDTVTPEEGIEGYIYDQTQGPACAIACAAGTAYRNYLVSVPFETTSKRGQHKRAQLNGLEKVENYLECRLDQVPWEVRNGYIESTREKLEDLNALLKNESVVREEIISLLCIGVQEDTTITDLPPEQQALLTQTYNSAISIGYSSLPTHLWEPIAKIVLDATYEATMLVGLLKTIEARAAGKSRPPPILLTKVGGGVFQNCDSWIIASIARAIERVQQYGIETDVRIVHFGTVDEAYRKLEV